MKRKRKHVLILVVFCLTAICGVFAYFTRLDDGIKNVVTVIVSQPTANSSQISEEADNTEVEITAVGDCTLGNDYRISNDNVNSFSYYINKLHKPYSYFFDNVRQYFDVNGLNLANCEVVFTKSDNRIEKKDQTGGEWWLKGDPENAKIFREGHIDAVNIANNHSMDFLQRGLDDTKQALQKAGVQYFGLGNVAIIEKKNIKFAMLGYNLLGPVEEGIDEAGMKQELKQSINSLKKQANFIVVMFHWGDESTYQPNSQQEDFGHFAIDCGADLVLGSHPHTIQPIERYQGKYIVYSLGNFCYGGRINIEDSKTFIFKEKVKFNAERQAYDSQYNIIPCVYSANPINNYQPTANIPSTIADDIASIVNQK